MKKVTQIAQSITPKNSATTLEVAFEIKSGNKTVLLTISYGDSETIICRKDGSIQQLNEITITGSKKNSSQIDIFNQQDLEKMEPFFKRYSDPGGVVSGSEVDHPSAAFIELNSGDQYITCTDGVGDAISIRNERFRSAKVRSRVFKGHHDVEPVKEARRISDRCFYCRYIRHLFKKKG